MQFFCVLNINRKDMVFHNIIPLRLWHLASQQRWRHDDVIKWKHFPRNWPFVWGIHRSPVNSPHKGQWRGASMFSLICAWINGWVNNREAGDLRRYRSHYDVTVMGLAPNQWGFAIWDIYPKCILNSNLVNSPSCIGLPLVVRLHWNFAESMAISLPYSVQKFNTVKQREVSYGHTRLPEIWV